MVRTGLTLVVAALAVSGPAVASTTRPPFDAAISEAKAAMVSQPATALLKAREAVATARGLPAGPDRDLDTANALWLEGEALTRVKAPAAALPQLDEALRVAAGTAPGSKLNGDVLKARLCRQERGLVYLLTVLGQSGKVTRARVDATDGKWIDGS